jgi:hypothetical protein
VEALAARLTKLAAKDISGGKWIHALHVHVDCESSALITLDGLVSILLQAHCLKRLYHHHLVSPSVVLAASYACPTTLQTIKVCVNDPGILVHIRAFRCLRELCVRLMPRLNLDDIPPLQLHGIKHFKWDSIPDSKHRSSLNYIQRCYFGHLQVFELSFQGLQPADIPYMLDVLGKHKTAFLNLRVNDSVCAAAILPHASAPRLQFNILSASLVDKIPDDVTSLRVYFANVVSSGGNMNPAWQVLQALAEGTQKTSIEQIEITTSHPGRFLWWRQDSAQDYDSFVARMLRVSILLQRRGIRLLDENGESLHLNK